MKRENMKKLGIKCLVLLGIGLGLAACNPAKLPDFTKPPSHVWKCLTPEGDVYKTESPQNVNPSVCVRVRND